MNGVYSDILNYFFTSGHEFHKVTITLPGSKLYKGICAHVYEAASTSAAFYNGDKEQSIFYDGNDLHVVILFESRAGCVSFVNNLDGFLRHFQLLEDIRFDPNFERLRLLDYPTSIFQRDYDPNESDSEAYSIAITRPSLALGIYWLILQTERKMVHSSRHRSGRCTRVLAVVFHSYGNRKQSQRNGQVGPA
jgi:hypothetical protein